jgi:glycine cleavage system aminomethyltransferase T
MNRIDTTREPRAPAAQAAPIAPAGDWMAEALAVRTNAALFDFSFVQRLRLHGAGASAFLSAAFAEDVQMLAVGENREVVWRTSEGGVRGIGYLGRAGDTNFALQSFDADYAWFARYAPRFGAVVRDATGERSVLLLMGPYAFAVLAAAGLEGAARLATNRHAVFDWNGIAATIVRAAMPNGFIILMAQDDAPRAAGALVRAGRLFGLTPGSRTALDAVLLESGIPLPHIDFVPARANDAKNPTLSSLLPIDAARPSDRVLAGLELESETPAPFAPLLHGGATVGHTLRSLYSSALRRAIALTRIAANLAAPGTHLTARTVTLTGTKDIAARVAALPFL